MAVGGNTLPMRLLAIILVWYIHPVTPTLAQYNDTFPSLRLAPGFHYGFNLPAADLANRFGPFFGFGPESTLYYKRFMIQAGYTYYFGGRVKEDVLRFLRSSDGLIVGPGLLIPAYLRMRGYSTALTVGSWLGRPDQLWMIGLSAGPGWYGHRIRVLDESQSHPLLSQPYRAGYDRLSAGPLALGRLALLFKATPRAWFTLEAEYHVAWTKLQRNHQYDLTSPPHSSRRDYFAGLKIGWLWPFSLRNNPQQIFY